MKVLLINGTPDQNPQFTSYKITQHIIELFEKQGVETKAIHLGEKNIPMLHFQFDQIENQVHDFCNTLRDYDYHIWLSPLYHGGIPGIFKNALDWLEITSKEDRPYLTKHKIAFVSWGDGLKVSQGILMMDLIAKSLRAETNTFSIPILRKELFEEDQERLKENYQANFDYLVNDMIQQMAHDEWKKNNQSLQAKQE